MVSLAFLFRSRVCELSNSPYLSTQTVRETIRGDSKTFQPKSPTIMKLIVLVAILAVGCGAKAEKIYGVDDFDPIEVEKLSKLAPHFEKLSDTLVEKLRKHPEIKGDNPEAIMELAKKEMGSRSGCLGECLKLMKSQNKALELFVSLEDTIGKCDTESYEILARNYIAHQAVEYQSNAGMTLKMLDYYRARHAEHCRPVHTQRFADRVRFVLPGSVDRLEKAFSGLSIYDFGYSSKADDFRDESDQFDLVGMPKSHFLGHWALINLASRLKNPEDVIAAGQARYQLNVNLFEPCKSFRQLLATDLNEARFDAAVEDGQAQKDFLHGDEKFHQALVANRMCASLLEEQEKLYKPLMEYITTRVKLSQ